MKFLEEYMINCVKNGYFKNQWTIYTNKILKEYPIYQGLRHKNMSSVEYSDEKKTLANNLEICYDTFGEKDNPPLLLIMGLAHQMILWDERFCQALASAGYYVIRFDNRDVGLSSKIDGPVPDILQLMKEIRERKPISVPYKLSDMAKDTVGLLDQLGIESAHIIGVSMGGMIAQTMAIEYPSRVKTLTSISSTTGNPLLPQAKQEVTAMLVPPPTDNRDEAIGHSVKLFKVFNGTTYPFKEESYKKVFSKAYDRNYYPLGPVRQLAAIIASGSRNEKLRNVKIKTLVIHGDEDPAILVQAGEDTAKEIPDAKLVIIKGMGHTFGPEVAPQIISAILAHIK